MCTTSGWRCVVVNVWSPLRRVTASCHALGGGAPGRSNIRRLSCSARSGSRAFSPLPWRLNRSAVIDQRDLPRRGPTGGLILSSRRQRRSPRIGASGTSGEKICPRRDTCPSAGSPPAPFHPLPPAAIVASNRCWFLSPSLPWSWAKRCRGDYAIVSGVCKPSEEIFSVNVFTARLRAALRQTAAGRAR